MSRLPGYRVVRAVALAMAGVAAAVVSGCVAAVPASAPGPVSGGGATASSAEADVLPSGFGTLQQDDITVGLEVGAVQLRVTPLAPWILPLLAPETERRLRATATRAGGGAAGAHLPVLVSFFTDAAGGVPFEPAELVLVNRGRRFRAETIEGLTAGWEQSRLDQGRPAQALFLYDRAVDLEMELGVEFGGSRSDEWSSIAPRLQAEAARVRARAGSQSSSSNFLILR